MKLCFSPAKEPYFNLALEEYILKHLPGEESTVFVSVNEQSVIIGRNQNPWREVNLGYAIEKNIPVVRRISGGGTVFHDPGNINISFIQKYSSKSFNNYSEFTRPVISYLNSIGIPAELNTRNDIVVNGLKISGNAQFSSKNMMLSHGTLLVNSDLETLNKILEVKKLNFVSKSTSSTRSNVTSLSAFKGQELSVEEVISGISKELKYSFNVVKQELTGKDIEAVHKLIAEKYNTFEWNYGRTHDFEVESDSIPHIKVSVKAGLLHEVIIGGEIVALPPGSNIQFLPKSVLDSTLPNDIKRNLINTFF